MDVDVDLFFVDADSLGGWASSRWPTPVTTVGAISSAPCTYCSADATRLAAFAQRTSPHRGRLMNQARNEQDSGINLEQQCRQQWHADL
jgi:hypothetical protein